MACAVTISKQFSQYLADGRLICFEIPQSIEFEMLAMRRLPLQGSEILSETKALLRLGLPICLVLVYKIKDLDVTLHIPCLIPSVLGL